MDKVYPTQQLMRHKCEKFTWNNVAEESIQRIKKELCEAPGSRDANGKKGCTC